MKNREYDLSILSIAIKIFPILKEVVLIIFMIVGGLWAYFVYFNDSEFEITRLERENKKLELLPSLVAELKFNIVSELESNRKLVLITINFKNVGGGIASLLFKKPPLNIAKVEIAENSDVKFGNPISLNAYTLINNENSPNRQVAQIVKKGDEDALEFLVVLERGVYFVEFVADKGGYDYVNDRVFEFTDITPDHVRWSVRKYIEIE